MRRRVFIGLAATAALGFGTSVCAQTKRGLPVIGVLAPMKEETELARLRIAAVRKGLADEGYVDEKNYVLALRFLEGDFGRVDRLVEELGSLTPRVVVIGAMGIGAFHKLYPDTPLVFTGIAADPIALGWVQSYARPGGMLTGNVMNAVGGEETMAQKRLGFFRELVPDLKRLGIIGPVAGPLVTKEKDALHKVASQFGFEILHYDIRTADDLEGAFASGVSDDVSAFYISGEPLLFGNLSRVMALVTGARKPTFGPYPEWGRAGLLMSYSTDPLEGYRSAGAYAAKILKGARPSDLPVQQASKFTLVINQKTARSLGIVVPPSLMTVADEVIE